MSERFYINWPLQPGKVVLEGAEAHHLATVRRFRPGDAVCLFNGDGHEYPARIVQTHRRRVDLDITGVDSPARELPFHLAVAAPFPKGDRGHFLIEKLTELGATSFVPLATQRSVVHPRLEKLQRYVIEASKQCGRNVLMSIEPAADWASYCRGENLRGRKIVAHPGTRETTVLHTASAGDGFTLAVGPEGGFTDGEIEQARAAGWTPFDMGPRLLRIETAALVLAAWAIASRA
jgi:16S rRNA (uracil1498-N3)-methyltransferase